MPQNTNKSPYSASLTGAGFLVDEMTSVLPMLMSPDQDKLLRNEIINNQYLMINTENTRKRAVAEFKKRYAAVPFSYWEHHLTLSHSDQQMSMFYVMLKTYKVLLDFQLNVVLRQWNSVSQQVTNNDLLACINEISTKDDFVASWSDLTKSKIVSSFMTILKKLGMLDERTLDLQPMQASDQSFAYYIKIGEPWFLDACLLQPWEIDRIKQYAI